MGGLQTNSTTITKEPKKIIFASTHQKGYARKLLSAQSRSRKRTRYVSFQHQHWETLI